MKILTKLQVYSLPIFILFVIDCKEVTEYKIKNKINFERFDSIQKTIADRKKNLTFSYVKDIQNHVYKTIQIGNQTWMAQNLQVTCLNDSTEIKEFSATNCNTKMPQSTIYNSEKNMDSINIYGRLYNWYAVSSDKLCPVGWKIPSNSDWDSLILFLEKNYYGFDGNSKEIAKSLASNTMWKYGDVPGFIGYEPQSNNSSGFNSYPSGLILKDGSFKNKGEFTGWWSTNEASVDEADYYFLFYDYTILSRNSQSKNMGMSVRCVKK